MAISPTGKTPNPALYPLHQTQKALGTSLNQLSSGNRLVNASIDPSALAIATGLAVQVSAFDAASGNVQNALNATNVAAGGLQQVSGIISQIRTLAVAGANDFLSSTDRAALQAEANQLVAQANTIAGQTSFNGVNLLSGQFAGPQAGSPASATVTNNDALVQGTGGVISSVTAANANFQNASGAAQGFGGTATTDSTIQIQIVNNNGQAAAVATVVDSATGKQVQSGPVAAGGTISGFENVNIQLGNFNLADVGQTATVQIAQNVPANTQNNALTVQSGANEGSTSAVGVPSVSSSQLRIANIDLSTSLNATNAIGQLDNAAATLQSSLANLGAEQVRLQEHLQSNAIASNALTASQSQLADTNIGATVTNSTLQQVQNSLSTAVAAQYNVSAAAVLGLFR